MTPKEEQFVDMAKKMGYLSSSQIIPIVEKYSELLAKNICNNLMQFMLQHGYLSTLQMAEISRRISSDHPTQQFDRNVQDSSHDKSHAMTGTSSTELDSSSTEMGYSAPSAFPNLKSSNQKTRSQSFVKTNVKQALTTLSSVSLPQAKIEPGQLWRDFEIIEEIGSGGMGVVFKAKQKSPDRIVALKILIADKMSPSHIQRFVKEMQISTKLQHPNIVNVYLADIYQNIPFLAMAYIDGPSFHQYLKQSPPLEESLRILELIARALHYAHKNRVVHRDIKPGNILLNSSGEPYLMDFGIAISTRIEDRSLTKTGDVLGTPQYMSPEQAQGERRILDGRSDIYSLGAILYEIVTGCPSVKGENFLEVLYSLLKTPLIPPREINPEIPAALETIILKAMAFKKAKRYATAQDMAQDIRNFLDKKEISTVVARMPQLKRKLGRIHRVIWAVLLLLSIVPSLLILRHYALKPSLVNVDQFYRAAQQYLQAKEYAKAEEQLKELLYHSPGHKKALELRAIVLEKQEKWESLRVCWGELSELKLTPQDLIAISEKALYLGYLRDAQSYLKKCLEASPGDVIPCKMLLKISVHLGKYEEADKYLDKLKDETNSEISLQKALFYYYQQEYEKARPIFVQILSDSQIHSSLRAQTLFFRARLEWELIQSDLNQWQWLFDQTEEYARYNSLCDSLKQIALDINLSWKTAKETSGDNSYFWRHFQEHLEIYKNAIHFETKISGEICQEIEKFKNSMQKASMSIFNQIFFQDMFIRVLIRNKQWLEASKTCEDAIKHFPQIGNFYHLRAMIGFLQGENNPDVVKDVFRSVENEPWNFVPIENVCYILFERFVHQEAYEFWKIIAFYIDKFQAPVKSPVSHLIFRKLSQKIIKEQILTNKNEENIQWEILLNTICTSSSKEARAVAYSILTTQYQNRELREELLALKKKKLKPVVSEQLEKLYKDIQSQAIKSILLQYAIFPHPKHVRQVLAMKEQGEKILSDILQDSEQDSMMRIWAADMLASLKTISAFERLQTLSEQAPYPHNLIAASAIFKANVPIDIERILQKSANIDKTKDPVLQILFSFYADPQKHAEILRSWIKSDDEMVALCAAYCCYTHIMSLSDEVQKEVMECFTSLMNSPTPDVRAIAIRIFWQIEKIKKLSPEQQAARYCEYWEKYGDSLLEHFEREENKEVQFTLMNVIDASIAFERDMNRAKILEQPVFIKIKTVLLNIATSSKSSHFMKFWGTIALCKLDSDREIWEIIKNPEGNFLIRIGAICGLLATSVSQKDMSKTTGRIANFIDVLNKFGGGQIHSSKNDRRLRQLALFILVNLNIHMKIPWKFPNSILKDSDPAIRRTAVTVFMWKAQARDIPQLYEYLGTPDIENSDVHLQRAAAASLAYVISKYRRDEAEKFNAHVQKFSPLIRTAAAVGYYSPVVQDIHDFFTLLASPGLGKRYNEYIRVFEKKSQEDWSFFLENANLVSKHPRYCYENALICAKFQEISEAYELIDDEVLKEAPNIDDGEDFHRLAKLLQVRLYLQEGKDREAMKSLEQLCATYPFDAQVHMYLAMIYKKQNNEREYKIHFWQSFLCAPENIFANVIEHTNSLTPVEILQIIDKKFPLNYSFVENHFPWLAQNPWVKLLRTE